MNLNTITSIWGNLRDAYKQAVPGTMRHVDELMNERRTNPITPEGDDLCNTSFYAADGLLYFVDRDTPKLAVTRESDNLVLRHITKIFTRLSNDVNYRPNFDEAAAAIAAKDTDVFDLNKLVLSGQNDELGNMDISTTKYDQLNAEQRRLAERVYSSGDDFIANMAMLQEAGIGATGVCILNFRYVKQNAVGSPIARVSWLEPFIYTSRFLAINRDFGSNDFGSRPHLRAMLKNNIH